MSINIKNVETEELARQLASATGESLTGAVTAALRERLDRVHHPEGSGSAERLVRLRRIAADAAGRWVEPWSSVEHGDLLYDDAGLPR